MNFRKIIMCGIIAGLASFLVSFGGLLPWLGLMGLGGIISTILLAALFSFTEKGLTGVAWKKGLFFGFLFWLVAGLPNAFNTWLLHSYPQMS